MDPRPQRIFLALQTLTSWKSTNYRLLAEHGREVPGPLCTDVGHGSHVLNGHGHAPLGQWLVDVEEIPRTINITSK
eukprot:10761276-Alexandrium_andersonii.AAC.1